MGINSDYPLSADEFKQIYEKVPRLTVELIVKTADGILLTLRSIKPYAGFWHIPGGTVYYGESVQETINRVAMRELGITPINPKFIGIIEYPSLVKIGYGDPKGLAYLITDFEGDIEVDSGAEEAKWFKAYPEDTIPDQVEFIKDNQLL
jgi:ADP-ribose pyrophosphatase YjhB (NUDIX family)